MVISNINHDKMIFHHTQKLFLPNFNTMKLPAAVFIDAGSFYINNRDPNQKKQVSPRIFKAHFRLDGEGFSDLWHKLSCHIKHNDSQNTVLFSTCQPSHLLWALHYMYVYSSKGVCASFIGISAKTYRKYVWAIISFLSTTSNGIVSFLLLI